MILIRKKPCRHFELRKYGVPHYNAETRSGVQSQGKRPRPVFFFDHIAFPCLGYLYIWQVKFLQVLCDFLFCSHVVFLNPACFSLIRWIVFSHKYFFHERGAPFRGSRALDRCWLFSKSLWPLRNGRSNIIKYIVGVHAFKPDYKLWSNLCL